MRFTYIFAVIIVATLHASGTALAIIQDFNHTSISSEATEDIAQSLEETQDNGRRMLGKVEKYVENEERGFSEAFKNLKSSIAKHIPGTHASKIKKTFKDAADNQKFLERARKMINKNYPGNIQSRISRTRVGRQSSSPSKC